MKILKYQISWKYSNIKFHLNTQISNFTKILKDQISLKYSNIKFHENPSSGSTSCLMQTGEHRQTDRHMAKLIVAFRNFAKAPNEPSSKQFMSTYAHPIRQCPFTASVKTRRFCSKVSESVYWRNNWTALRVIV